jgi:hypothetical protein
VGHGGGLIRDGKFKDVKATARTTLYIDQSRVLFGNESKFYVMVA